MQRISVVSRDLKSIGYDEAANVLEIEFNSGSIYNYFSVPQQIYNELMEAPSKGKYFHAYIRPVFRYQKIS